MRRGVRGGAVAIGIGVLALASCTDLGGLSGGAGAGVPDASPDAPLTSAEAGGGGGADAGTYAAEVLADQPIAYWRLGEANGTLAHDAVTPGHDALYAGAFQLGVPGAIAGDPDTAVHLGGGTDRIEVTPPDAWHFTPKAPYTVEVWFKRESGFGLVGLMASDGVTKYWGWALAFSTQGNLASWRYDGASTGVAMTPSAAPAGDGQFHHVVSTFDGAELLLYLDGVAVQLVTDGIGDLGTPAAGTRLTIGALDDWGEFRGAIDEVALYDHALAPARVVAHYAKAGGK